jgi:hypothetical protein
MPELDKSERDPNVKRQSFFTPELDKSELDPNVKRQIDAIDKNTHATRAIAVLLIYSVVTSGSVFLFTIIASVLEDGWQTFFIFIAFATALVGGWYTISRAWDALSKSEVPPSY